MRALSKQNARAMVSNVKARLIEFGWTFKDNGNGNDIWTAPHGSLISSENTIPGGGGGGAATKGSGRGVGGGDPLDDLPDPSVRSPRVVTLQPLTVNNTVGSPHGSPLPHSPTIPAAA